MALAASTNAYWVSKGLTLFSTNASTKVLSIPKKALTSNPLTFEASKPAPHNSLASNWNSKQKDKNAFKAFNLSTWFSNFFWNLAFSNLTPFKASIRAVKRYLPPVEFPLTDNNNCNAFKDNSSSGAVKNSSGRNSDLNEALKLWKSEIFIPKFKRGSKSSPLTLTKSTETLFPLVLKWISKFSGCFLKNGNSLTKGSTNFLKSSSKFLTPASSLAFIESDKTDNAFPI